jgi:hypothetical protein
MSSAFDLIQVELTIRFSCSNHPCENPPFDCAVSEALVVKQR